jgi:putative hydrolase of the HAD superfamily
MKTIRCLMLDMGGVLTREHRLDKVDAMTARLGLSCPRERFLEAYYAERFDYDRGSLEGGAYWGRVARALGAALDPTAAGDLVRLDLESWFNMRSAMLDFLGGAKGRLGRLVLLSNIHFDGARYLREGEGRAWAERFDELVLSCEHGLLKPELEIYELALGAAGAQPSETLFVDDNPDNVEGARRAGMSSFRFVGEEDFISTIARDYEFSR